jgi:hypothetical protein
VSCHHPPLVLVIYFHSLYCFDLELLRRCSTSNISSIHSLTSTAAQTSHVCTKRQRPQGLHKALGVVGLPFVRTRQARAHLTTTLFRTGHAHSSVICTGDFDEWKGSQPLHKENGKWVADVKLPYGEKQVKYKVGSWQPASRTLAFASGSDRATTKSRPALYHN